MVRDRLISAILVIAFSLILIMVLALSASLTGQHGWLKSLFTPETYFLLEVANLLTSFGVAALVLALTFKFLPAVKISWQVVWVGALVTSFFLNAGVFLIGLYLGGGGTQSALGAAGSVVLLMVWIYYSAQIVFFGAKFVRVYASAIGKPILPARHAVSTKQGEV